MQLEGALNLVIYMVGSLWVWTYLKDVNNQYQVWNPSKKKKTKTKKQKTKQKQRRSVKLWAFFPLEFSVHIPTWVMFIIHKQVYTILYKLQNSKAIEIMIFKMKNHDFK